MDPNPTRANYSTWDANAIYGSDRLQKAVCALVDMCGHLEAQMHKYEFLVFSSLQIGKIYEMRMMMDFNGNNRGYAFVTFSNKQEAKNAIKQLNNYEIR